MTSNQLTLGKLREEVRHNKATEGYGYATLGESKRHNLATERYSYAALGETKRHNIQSERIGYGNISLGYGQLAESKRHNIATEEYQGEQARAYANKAVTDAAYTELQIEHYIDELKVRQDQAEASLRNAATAEKQAEISQQLADIKAELAYWEKQRTKTQMFVDVTEGIGNVVETMGDVAGLLKP